MISKTEAVNALTLEHRVAISNLEDKLADLTNLCGAKDANTQRLESEVLRLQRQLQRTTDTPGERKSAPRSITVSSPVKPASSTAVEVGQGSGAGDSSLSGSSASDAQLLTALRNQVARLTLQLREADAKNNELFSAVTAREQELTRLSSRLVDGEGMGGTSKAAQLELINQQNQRLVAQLNEQVDFLNEQLAQRELQLAKLNDKCIGMETQLLGVSQREELVIKLRRENDGLVAAVRATEGKLLQLQHAIEEQRVSYEEQLLALRGSEQLVRDELDSSMARLADELRAMQAQPSSPVPPPEVAMTTKDDAIIDKQERALLSGQLTALSEHYEERGRELDDLKNQLHTTRASLAELTIQYQRSSRRESELESRVIELSAEVKGLQMFREISQAELRKSAAAFQERSEEGVSPFTQEKPALRLEVEAEVQNRAEEAYKLEIESMQFEITSLQHQLSTLTTMSSDEQVDNLKFELAAVKRQEQTLESDKESYKEALHAMQEEVSKLTSQLKAREQEIFKLEQQVRQASSAQVSFNNRAVALVEERNNLASELATARKQIEDLSCKLPSDESAEKMMSGVTDDKYQQAIHSEIARLQGTVEALTSQRDEVIRNSQALERELMNANKTIDELQVFVQH